MHASCTARAALFPSPVNRLPPPRGLDGTAGAPAAFLPGNRLRSVPMKGILAWLIGIPIPIIIILYLIDVF